MADAAPTAINPTEAAARTSVRNLFILSPFKHKHFCIAFPGTKRPVSGKGCYASAARLIFRQPGPHQDKPSVSLSFFLQPERTARMGCIFNSAQPAMSQAAIERPRFVARRTRHEPR